MQSGDRRILSDQRTLSATYTELVMPRVIDCIMACYELDAINVRLAELEGVVDVHHAVQATRTFRGDAHEPLELPEKVVSRIVDLQVAFEDNAPAQSRPWTVEGALRNISLDVAATIDSDAFFMVCDGDEIPHPDAIWQAVEEYDAKGPRILLVDHRQWYADWRAPDAEQYPNLTQGFPMIGKYDDFIRVGGATVARGRTFWAPFCLTMR